MTQPLDPIMAARNGRLIIVYNADRGWASALMDAAHKLVRPATYGCSLCMISHGAVSMRRPWRLYLASLPMEIDFYHRQDFADTYGARFFPMVEGLSLPAILLEASGKLHGLLSSQELDGLADVEGLVAAVDQALNQPTKQFAADSSQ